MKVPGLTVICPVCAGLFWQVTCPVRNGVQSDGSYRAALTERALAI